jgi:hypothetical protein
MFQGAAALVGRALSGLVARSPLKVPLSVHGVVHPLRVARRDEGATGVSSQDGRRRPRQRSLVPSAAAAEAGDPGAAGTLRPHGDVEGSYVPEWSSRDTPTSADGAAPASPLGPAAAAILDSLSIEQRAAALAPERYVRCIAGPGSGKTRVIMARIAHVLVNHEAALAEAAAARGSESGAPSTSGRGAGVLAITFTNKAANELAERLHNSLGDLSPRQVLTCTFHSAFCKVLR